MNIPQNKYTEEEKTYHVVFSLIKFQPSKTWGLASSNEESLMLRSLSSTCTKWRAATEKYCWNECNQTSLFTRIMQGHLSYVIANSCSFPRGDNRTLVDYQPQIDTVVTIIRHINDGNAIPLDKKTLSHLSHLYDTLSTILAKDENKPFCAKLLAGLLHLKVDIPCQFFINILTDGQKKDLKESESFLANIELIKKAQEAQLKLNAKQKELEFLNKSDATLMRFVILFLFATICFIIPHFLWPC